MKRPVIYWISLFILGEIISLHLSLAGMSLCLLGVLFVILCTPYFFNRFVWLRDNKKVWLFGIVFLIFGVVNMYWLSEDRKVFSSACDQKTQFSGRVTEVENYTYGTYYTVKPDAVMINGAGYHIHRKIRVELNSPEDLQNGQKLLPGDYIKGRGIGEMFSHATNPGCYDEESFMLGSGIYLSIKEVTIDECKRYPFSVLQMLYKIRKRFQQVYASSLSEKDASLAAAMVLGEKSGLDHDVKEMYQQNGIAHLIAISGLHIAMIGGTLYQLLRKLVGGYVIPAVVGIGFILLYGGMTGLSGATCRAVIMLAVSLCAQLLGRKYDILTAVSFSILIMLINNPFQITQAGFLLSYGAVLAIAFINPVWKELFPKLPKWTEGFFVSVSVQLCITPIMLYFFYEIPVYSIILNVIVVPIMSILLFFLLMSGMVGLFFPEGGCLLAVPVKIIFRFYEFLCKMNQQLPGTEFCMGKPKAWWMLTYYFGLIFFLLLIYHREKIIKVRKRIFPAICGIFFVLLFILISPVVTKDDFMVCMFDVGQGDSIYIRTPGHYNLLIDGGSSSKKNIGKYILEKGLKYYGCNRLDYVFITHSDSDHYSGIKELLEDDRMKIKNLILPGIQNPDGAYQELEHLALEKNVHIYYMCRGDSLVVDHVFFQCLNPEKISYEDKNTGSLVFLLRYKQFDMLLTGDMDEIVEKKLVKQKDEWYTDNINGELDVLKVSHHGSNTASSKEFLDLLNPKIALVSVGENNRYGHPHRETVEKLEKSGSKIFYTMETGQITIGVNKKKIWVRTYR